MERGGDIHM